MYVKRQIFRIIIKCLILKLPTYRRYYRAALVCLYRKLLYYCYYILNGRKVFRVNETNINIYKIIEKKWQVTFQHLQVIIFTREQKYNRQANFA